MIATLATLLTLTLPQRKALGAHLVAFARALDEALDREHQDGDLATMLIARSKVVITIRAAQGIADRITAWGAARVQVREGQVWTQDGAAYDCPKDTDLAVLQAAVYLSPARDMIDTVVLRALERAWTKLGWAWQWPGQGLDAAVSIGDTSGVDAALEAERMIRAILKPGSKPPPAERPA